MSRYPSVPLPPATLALPDKIVLISYDYEGTRGRDTYANGSSFALGFCAVLWPERIILPGSVFFAACKPTTGFDTGTWAFWQTHASLLGYLQAAARHRRAVIAHRAIAAWDRLAHRLDRPLGFIARPHAYDSRHLADMLDAAAHIGPSLATRTRAATLLAQISNAEIPMFDLVPTLAHHRNVDAVTAKHIFNSLLGPGDTGRHTPDIDSGDQAGAFLRGLTTPLAQLNLT